MTKPAPTRPSILIVEDDPDSLHMLATMLESDGYTVVTAKNGLEAFNLARQHLPALIILDLMMPVMTGEQFRQAQIANHDIRHIPVVVLSAHNNAVAIAKKMRAAGCLLKPVDSMRSARPCAGSAGDAFGN
jgi:CheY-like chemotaxis protein